MGMGDMLDRCMDAMGSMMGGSIMGSDLLVVAEIALLVLWLGGWPLSECWASGLFSGPPGRDTRPAARE